MLTKQQAKDHLKKLGNDEEESVMLSDSFIELTEFMFFTDEERNDIQDRLNELTNRKE